MAVYVNDDASYTLPGTLPRPHLLPVICYWPSPSLPGYRTTRQLCMLGINVISTLTRFLIRLIKSMLSIYMESRAMLLP
jgi:hypothetical protein